MAAILQARCGANNFLGAGAAKSKGGRDDKVIVAPADGASSSSDGEGGGTASTGLPMANLVRLMRQVIPKGVKISARAKSLTHDCAVDFIGFVASEASEQAMAQHRRIVAPEDFTRSFQTLGFDDYVKPMTTYIRRYREQHNNNNDDAGGDYSGFARRPPPPPATAAAVTAPVEPLFSGEETQHHGPMVHPPHPHGEYDVPGSTSVHAPTPGAHGHGHA